MGFLNALDVCASGMTAQWMRMDVAAENITNATTTRTENGGPYRRKMVVFEPVSENNNFRKYLRDASLRQEDIGKGVKVTQIVEDERPFERVYDPTHPDADENGYVEMPNVDILKETIDSMAASRAYDASLTAFNVFKTMASRALEIGK
ncbi:MAG: flagellar basal body rod protein FlgC [Clostridiales bacterium]|nr:flagellar basal body rod protein FlgC [Clostridiales bacterium]